MKYFIFIIVTVLGLHLIGVTGGLYAQEVPADRQAKIFKTVLNFDNNLKNRVGDSILIMVLSKFNDKKSAKHFNRIFKAINGLSKNKIQGLSLEVKEKVILPDTDFESIIKDEKADVFYICEGMDDVLKNIINASIKKGVVTLSDSIKYVEEGVVVGIKLSNNKPKIIINIKSAKLSDIDFDIRLLRLSDIVR